MGAMGNGAAGRAAELPAPDARPCGGPVLALRSDVPVPSRPGGSAVMIFTGGIEADEGK